MTWRTFIHSFSHLYLLRNFDITQRKANESCTCVDCVVCTDEKAVVCVPCRRTFVHLCRLCTDEKAVVSVPCRHTFVHLCRLCTDEKVVVCLLCQRTFMHQFSYSEHFQKTHLRHFTHFCESCGRWFWKHTDKIKHRYDMLVHLCMVP